VGRGGEEVDCADEKWLSVKVDFLLLNTRFAAKGHITDWQGVDRLTGDTPEDHIKTYESLCADRDFLIESPIHMSQH
jgi:hypothetical protein